MKILVTGASGFLGQAVVRAAADAGHDIVALVRPTARTEGLGWPANVEIVRGDLRQRGAWRNALEVDVVLHLAAAPSGDLPTQFAGTVQATENLLESLDLKALKRFVHVSSFSVYDYSTRYVGRTLDERTAIEPTPQKRDVYTITKLIQEELVVDMCRDAGTSTVIIRPGAIYGPGKTWDFGRAMKAGRFDLVFAPMGVHRLTYVDNCADAIVKAIDAPVPSGSAYNIVDDDLPSFARYHRMTRRAGARTGLGVPVPWFLLAGLGLGVRALNRFALKNRAKLPELLEYKRQQARWRPLRYSNARAKEELGWSPRIGLEEGIARMMAAEWDAKD